MADFAGNEYVSSAGLRVFLSVLKALEKVGGRMVLCAMPPFVLDVFTISGFSGLFTIVGARRGGRRTERGCAAVGGRCRLSEWQHQ